MSQLEVDKVLPQSGTTITLGESGDTITVPSGATLDASNATVTIPAVNLTTGVTGTLPVANGGTNLTSGFANGITMADQWRLTASITATNGDITANLERNDSPSYGSIGTGMTESSGIFSFPSTGIYLVTVSAYFNSTSGVVDYMGVGTMVTINNSSYSTVNQNYCNANATDQYGGVFIADIIDVTVTANVKVKFNVSTENANFRLFGATNNNATSFTFIRLGDT